MFERLPNHLQHLEGLIVWRTLQGPFGKVETLQDTVNMNEPIFEVFTPKQDIITVQSIIDSIATSKSCLKLVSRWYDGVQFIYCYNGNFITQHNLYEAHRNGVLTIGELS